MGDGSEMVKVNVAKLDKLSSFNLWNSQGEEVNQLPKTVLPFPHRHPNRQNKRRRKVIL